MVYSELYLFSGPKTGTIVFAHHFKSTIPLIHRYIGENNRSLFERLAIFFNTVLCPLSRDALCCFYICSSIYQLGCTVATVSAQRPVEHVKNNNQNITTEGTKQSVHHLSNL